MIETSLFIKRGGDPLVDKALDLARTRKRLSFLDLLPPPAPSRMSLEDLFLVYCYTGDFEKLHPLCATGLFKAPFSLEGSPAELSARFFEYCRQDPSRYSRARAAAASAAYVFESEWKKEHWGSELDAPQRQDLEDTGSVVMATMRSEYSYMAAAFSIRDRYPKVSLCALLTKFDDKGDPASQVFFANISKANTSSQFFLKQNASEPFQDWRVTPPAELGALLRN
jgi:hypothetical protein